MRRLLGSVLPLAVLTPALAACSGPGEPSGEGSGPASSSVAPQPGATTAGPGADEVPPGLDESPDGAPPPADEDLDDRALASLLRTRSTVGGPGHCGPADVEVALAGWDSSLGHRYSRIVVRNTSGQACLVEGVPGIGVRGEWGSRFVPEVQHDDWALDGTSLDTAALRLAPGERASAELEWTGDLAGASAEQPSLLVVQLASDQVPIPLRAEVEGSGIDIGMLTTIRLRPFAPG